MSLFSRWFGSKERRILILGLDGAGSFHIFTYIFSKCDQNLWFFVSSTGKTTILYRLQVGEVVTTIPSKFFNLASENCFLNFYIFSYFLLLIAIGFNVETVTYKNLKFQVWDLGGQTSIRYELYLFFYISTFFSSFFSFVLFNQKDPTGDVIIQILTQ